GSAQWMMRPVRCNNMGRTVAAVWYAGVVRSRLWQGHGVALPVFLLLALCRSLAELAYQALPEGDRLCAGRIACLLTDSGVDHDEPAGRVDEERLAAHAQEREHPPLPWEDPDLIAVAEERPRGAGLQVRLVRGDPCGLLHP